jgi:hypothetical protein
MFRLIASLLCACSFVCASAAERIPADCRWMIQADVQAVMRSQIGGLIIQKLQQQPHAARLSILQSVIGLDPRRDLRTVTICGVGADDDTGLVLVRGTFDAGRLTALAQAAQGHLALAVGSRTIHTWQDKGRPAAGCLAGPDLLILAKTSTRIREALSVLDDPAAAGHVLAVPAGWDTSALMLCAADRMGEIVVGKPESALLRQVSTMSARVVEDGPNLAVEARALAANDTAAQQLVDAARGLSVLVQLQKAESVDPALLQALRTATISREGAVMSLRLAVAMADVVRLVEARIR